MVEPQPAPDADRPSAGVRALVVLFWVFASAIFVWNHLVLPYRIEGVDYGKHWIASGRILAGESPYTGELFLSFNYPLFIAFIYAPLAFVTHETGERIFDALNFLMMSGAAAFLICGLRPRREPGREWMHDFWGPLVVLFFAVNNSVRRLMWSGNVDGLNVLLLCAFMTLLIRGKERWAGLALGAVVLVKVAPVLFFLPVFALRKWRCLAVGLGVIALYWLLLFATGWARIETQLFREVLPGIPWFWRHISLSFHNVVAEFGWGWDNISEHGYRRLVLVVNAVMMLALCAVVWLRWRVVGDSTERVMILSYQWLIAFVPLLEMIHVSWVLPALFVGLRAWTERRLPTMLMLPWLLSWAILVHIDIFGQFFALWADVGLHPHHFMTMIVALSLAAVTVYTLQPRAASEGPQP